MRQSECKPGKQYDIGIIKYTHDLVIKYNDRQIYRVRDKSHTLRGGTIVIEQLNGTTLAVCKIHSFGRGRKIFLGEPKAEDEAACVDLQSDNGGLRFDVNGKTSVWKRTGKNDYSLTDKATEEVLMMFLDNSNNLHNPAPQINFFIDMEKDFERTCLAALFSLARRDTGSLDSMTRLAIGSAGGGIMIAGGGGGA